MNTQEISSSSEPMINLTRLDITGLIDSQTPKDVLIEIANAHGIRYDESHLDHEIYFNQLVHQIYVTNVPRVSINVNSHRAIARFVNYQGQWTTTSLISAFHFLIRYFDRAAFSSIPDNFDIGLQTPDHPYRLNACVLYGYCRYYDLQTTYQTSMTDMVQLIQLVRYPTINLRSQILDRLNASTLSKSDYINILMLMRSNHHSSSQSVTQPTVQPVTQPTVRSSSQPNDEPRKSQPTFAELTMVAQRYRRDRNLVQSSPLRANNNVEAIVYAAIIHQLDLSEVDDPSREYLALTRLPYVPYHVEFQERIRSRVPGLNSPYLNECFNPYLPREFYSSNVLNELARKEGYKPEEIQTGDVYELLQVAVLSMTFYHGKYGQIKNTQTVTNLDHLSELNVHEVVCYGIRGQEMQAYTYAELKSTFETLRNFQDPVGVLGTQFSHLAINKLQGLASNPRDSNESPNHYQIRLQLSQVIQSVKLCLDNTFRECTTLVETYRTLSGIQKLQVQNAVMSLHRLAMFMRGWDGRSAMPLTSAPVHNRQGEIDIRVSEAIVEFEKCCDNLGSIGLRLSILPLLQHRDGRFVASTDQSDGLTIRDRLNIVKAGDHSDNISGCIRLTSNWLAATSHYLMNVLGMPLPYDIHQLAHIA